MRCLGRQARGCCGRRARLGLLDQTAAVIMTAHPDIEPVPGVVVISKPLDLDDFLEQLRKLLDSGYRTRSALPCMSRDIGSSWCST